MKICNVKTKTIRMVLNTTHHVYCVGCGNIINESITVMFALDLSIHALYATHRDGHKYSVCYCCMQGITRNVYYI